MNNEESELAKYCDAKSKFKLKALQYIVTHKNFLKLSESMTEKEQSEKLKKKNESQWSKWLESGQSILQRVQGMLPTSGKCTVTRITELLMNTDSSSLANVATSSVHSLTNSYLKNVNKNYVTFD